MPEPETKSLRSKLAEAESIIEALRTGRVDAVVGEQQVLLLRLQDVEEQLQQSEARYRAVVEDQTDLVYRWNPEGRLTFVNRAFCQFLQQPREELVGHFIGAALPTGANYLGIVVQLSSMDAYQPSFFQEYRVERPTGEVCWLNVTHRLIRDEQARPAEIQSVAHDVTARREAQDQLHQVNVELEQRVEERTAQLRALVHELGEAEQRERRRLAQFLHDDLQQLLVAAKANLGLVRNDAMSDRQTRAFERTLNTLDRSIASSRSLVSQLSPPTLQNAGLLTALHWLSDQMFEMHQLPVHVQGDAQAEPESNQTRDLLFGFSRELLFNVAKHAEATEAWVETRRRSDGQIEVEVRDNGVGFDVARSSSAGERIASFGLRSIDERLRVLGGELQVSSAPGQGSRIALAAPAVMTGVQQDTKPDP